MQSQKRKKFSLKSYFFNVFQSIFIIDGKKAKNYFLQNKYFSQKLHKITLFRFFKSFFYDDIYLSYECINPFSTFLGVLQYFNDKTRFF